MKILVVYDSLYGNTEKIAQSIASVIDHAVLKRVTDVNKADVESLDFLIVGSPTQGGRPTPAIQQFLNDFAEKISGVKVATFDTRLAKGGHGLGLKLLMNVIGFASEKISKNMQKRGAIIVGEPTGFIVTGKEGPLDEGEVKRAQVWAREVSHHD